VSIEKLNVMNDLKKDQINVPIRVEVNTTPNKDLTFPPTYKVWDGVEMRTREICASAGEVQVGVGYMKEFETDASGVMRPREVAVYRTQEF